MAEPSFSNVASVLPKEGYQMCFPVNVMNYSAGRFRVTFYAIRMLCNLKA